MSSVAVVTGANQGLGLALVRGLGHRLGEGGVVYLTARDRTRGEEAVRLLESEGLRPRLALLDVRDDASVRELADRLRAEHGGVDVVISNAAARITPDRPQAEQVGEFVDTNNHGTYRMIKAFVPLLNDGARFVVVASSFGSVRNLPSKLHDRFDERKVTLEEIEQSMDEYAGLVQDGQAKIKGWPDWINVPSKVGQVASVRVLARSLEDAADRDILVAAACPGLVDTAASRPWFGDMSAALSPDQAAEDVLWLALAAPGSREGHGELVQHRRVLPYRF
ncbi:NAD(P)-dependent dehydrogenase (short-subunit alcohol dehydrogenase family) [Kitasatospora gansuensis]|uniref:NAD(P)-dependent dehydrogenase (Short-subunit alcohol dehydrogenase family) n=1 Tax=Kitasatospora gansuensis TaxID=258050 RepID=A0A7W7WHN4_9ACTN|nr:SDR family NAD(P)-dependent oxidoreductase [Kitasatospora gansuensis]MBB4947308.1 NAD(P)-dependent dehydrogenase (short-subunit alcohol dehydrogenase family) [Kitasatospora gansuensis]